MADFDPDAYLAAKTKIFDPDAYLAEKNAKVPPSGEKPTNWGRMGATTVGGVLGGIAAAPAAGLASVPTMGLGGVATEMAWRLSWMQAVRITKPWSAIRKTILVTVGCLAKTMSANSPTVRCFTPDRDAKIRHSETVKPAASTCA